MVLLLTTTSAPRLAALYKSAGVATTATWSAVSIASLSVHPTLDLPLRHNALTIAQALAPTPLVYAAFAALSAAALSSGYDRLSSSTYRRLNLALATASLWLAAAAAFAPVFAVGYKMLPPPAAALVTALHLSVACLCLGAWGKTVRASPRPLAGHYLPRIVRGCAGSLCSLFPSGSALDDPDAHPDGRSLYALATMGFLWFTVMPNLVAFPLATVPTILGKRLSRAASAWTFLSATTAYILKDGAERGRLHASTFCTLRRGLAAASGAHLFVVALKLSGADGGMAGLRAYYPAALSCPKASFLSLCVHALALFACLTPPPKSEAAEA